MRPLSSSGEGGFPYYTCISILIAAGRLDPWIQQEFDFRIPPQGVPKSYRWSQIFPKLGTSDLHEALPPVAYTPIHYSVFGYPRGESGLCLRIHDHPRHSYVTTVFIATAQGNSTQCCRTSTTCSR